MEILEAYEPNSGRDPCPVFLKRCRSQECTDCAAQSRLELSSHHRGGCHTVTVTARHRRGPRSQASRLVRHWRSMIGPPTKRGCSSALINAAARRSPQSRLELSSHHRRGCHTVTVTARHRRGPRSQASRLVRHWRSRTDPPPKRGCSSALTNTAARRSPQPRLELSSPHRRGGGA